MYDGFLTIYIQKIVFDKNYKQIYKKYFFYPWEALKIKIYNINFN